MTSTLGHPILYAMKRVLDVWWTGVLALVFWLVLTSLGPYAETRWAPVVDRFHIVAIDDSDPDVVKFRPAFEKNRNCVYLGMQWFVMDDKGVVSRHQVLTSDSVRTPMTFPVGPVLGDWWQVGTRDRDREMYGIMHHGCGLPWESRSLVGPFSVSKSLAGKVSLTQMARR